METNILKYVWKHSRPQQLWMLVVVLFSMPTYFLSLELPKRIVNGPIQGVGFENPGDTGIFLQIWLPFSQWLTGKPIELFDGFKLERVDFLTALSLTFLALVIINGLFKMYINSYKGRMGERLMRRLRYELFDRVLRYPLARFRRTKPSEIASMIKDEVEPMGEFIGDAFTQPLFLGGQALTGLIFIFLQHVGLGLVTLVVVLFQAWLIPRLRRQLITLGKQRQIQARVLSGKIGETVESIRDIHVNDTSNYHRAMISDIMGKLYFIRYEQYQRKYFIKFINNFLMQFLAFFFYAVGGYLAIRGTIDLGQLLGVIVAYKDLPDPIRALIDYDQRRLIVDARYNQIVEQFTTDDLTPLERYIPKGDIPQKLEAGYEFSSLSVMDESGSTLLSNISTSIKPGEHLALVGAINSGARDFGEVLAGLQHPTSGRAMLNNTPIADIPEYVTGRRISYVDADTYFPQNTIFDTLTQVLKNQPVRNFDKRRRKPRKDSRRYNEALLSGNSVQDIRTNWIDYERLGFTSEKELYAHIREVIEITELKGDIENLGLRGRIDPVKKPELAEKILQARKIFRERLGELGLADIVEPFDPDKYNHQATIAENLLFGTATNAAFTPERLVTNPVARKELSNADDLRKLLFEMGKEIAETTIELFGELSADNTFLDQLSYMDPEELPEYRVLLNRIGSLDVSEVKAADETMVLRLSLSYVESKNRLGLITDELMAKVIEARAGMRSFLGSLPSNPVEFYEPDIYNSNSTILDNVLLGRISTDIADARSRVISVIGELLDELGLADEIFQVGLDFNIGTGGKRLDETQRQKLHLARGLLKKPDIIILNLALNALDLKTQRTLLNKMVDMETQGELDDLTIIWNLVDPRFASEFNRVLYFDKCSLAGDGTHEALAAGNREYRELTKG